MAGKRTKSKPGKEPLKTIIRKGAETHQDGSDWEAFENWMKKSKRCVKLRSELKKSKHEFTMREVCFPQKEPPSFFRSKILHLLINSLINHLQLQLQELDFEPAPKLGGYDSGKFPGTPTKEESAKLVMAYVQEQDPLLIPCLTHLIHLARHEQSPLHDDERAYLELRLQYINEAIVPSGMAKFDWKQRGEELLASYEAWDRGQISFPQGETEQELKDQIAIINDQGIDDEDINLLTTHFGDEEYKTDLKMMIIWNAAIDLDSANMVLIKTTDPLLLPHINFTIQSTLAGSFLPPVKQKLAAYWLALSEIKSDPSINNSEQWKYDIRNYHPPGFPRLKHLTQNTQPAKPGRTKQLPKSKRHQKQKITLGRMTLPKKYQLHPVEKSQKRSQTKKQQRQPSSANKRAPNSNTNKIGKTGKTLTGSLPKQTSARTSSAPAQPARSPKKVTPKPLVSSSSHQPKAQPVLREAHVNFGFQTPEIIHPEGNNNSSTLKTTKVGQQQVRAKTLTSVIAKLRSRQSGLHDQASELPAANDLSVFEFNEDQKGLSQYFSTGSALQRPKKTQ